MITVNNISKSFNNKTVIDNISFTIKKGEIFGLLGPNGAGKTTLLRLLSTVLEADSGETTILGYDLATNMALIKTKIGYVAQYFGLYNELTVLENIRFYASMYNIYDEELFTALMKRYEIEHYAQTKAQALSGGYKRRLSLICALTHNPEVLFLDEPTAGIDPVTRKHLWDIFYDLSQEGKTLFVTTHYMEEAERCHNIAFLNRGKIVSHGSVEEVKNALDGYNVLLLQTNVIKKELVNFLISQMDILLVNQFGNELRIVIKDSVTIEDFNARIALHVETAFEVSLVKANLEDVFIALTQKGSND